MKTKTFTEEEIFEKIDEFENELRDNHFIMTEEILKKLKDKFRTPQGFRRAIERTGLVEKKFGFLKQGEQNA